MRWHYHPRHSYPQAHPYAMSPQHGYWELEPWVLCQTICLCLGLKSYKYDHLDKEPCSEFFFHFTAGPSEL
jgi:hypothetical protein